ncbi:hypothetical protein EYF80_027958 [Liparis tanakae]|uniref:Uncharacterized protein n=1 Tax=Liparis tanakae TaxID=230148 RepID=A0A4Z2H875_9TELE|nr:hypothetical protein EYF80_027958 [Liparis tanakae]
MRASHECHPGATRCRREASVTAAFPTRYRESSDIVGGCMSTAESRMVLMSPVLLNVYSSLSNILRSWKPRLSCRSMGVRGRARLKESAGSRNVWKRSSSGSWSGSLITGRPESVGPVKVW